MPLCLHENFLFLVISKDGYLLNKISIGHLAEASMFTMCNMRKVQKTFDAVV